MALSWAHLLGQPHAEPEHHQPVRHALHVILNEEWEHLRFARRDLDTQAG